MGWADLELIDKKRHIMNGIPTCSLIWRHPSCDFWNIVAKGKIDHSEQDWVFCVEIFIILLNLTLGCFFYLSSWLKLETVLLITENNNTFIYLLCAFCYKSLLFCFFYVSFMLLFLLIILLHKQLTLSLIRQFCSRQLWTYFVKKYKISSIEWITYD